MKIASTAALLGGAFLFSASLLGAKAAAGIAPPAQIDLQLINGWQKGPTTQRIPTVRVGNGIVRFASMIATAHNNTHPFVLPAGYRPAHTVVLPVDMYGPTNGSLRITPDGTATVRAESNFYFAQKTTSLEGVEFALNGSGATPLTLIDGWQKVTGAAAPSARTVGGVVYLAGAITTTGTNAYPFQLPPSFRPAKVVYVAADTNNATNGRLNISPDGTVAVEGAGADNTNALAFTSLDGISFARNSTGYTPLALINGWQNGEYSTGRVGVRLINGIVHLRGAVSNGTDVHPFVLPDGFRPSDPMNVKADLCNGANGALFITTTGSVEIQEESHQFSDAQCFTSLDGISFVQ